MGEKKGEKTGQSWFSGHVSFAQAKKEKAYWLQKKGKNTRKTVVQISVTAKEVDIMVMFFVQMNKQKEDITSTVQGNTKPEHT